MAQPVYATPETLPDGICSLINSEQDRLILYAAHMPFMLNPNNSSANVYISDTAPLDHGPLVLWACIDSSGFFKRCYRFVNGAWMSLHPLRPGVTIIWTQALPDFNTFDDGDSNALGPTTGNFWEEVTELRAKFPFGVGTTEVAPNGTSTAVVQGDTGGHELEILDMTHLPATIPLDADLPGHRFNPETLAPLALAPKGSTNIWNTSPASEVGSFAFTNTGGGIGHQTMPPYYAVYFLRRTVREYYRIDP